MPLYLPRGYLSVSQINKYHRCPYQYYRQYILGERGGPNAALLTGSAVHESIEVDMQVKIDTGQLATLDQVKTATAERFQKEVPDVEDWEGLDPGRVKDHAVKVAEVHHTHCAPEFTPTAVEAEIDLVIDGIPVLGYADLLEQDTVIDHKVVGRHRSQKDADEDIQLTFYAYATGKRRVGFNSIRKDKKYQGGIGRGNIKQLYSTRSERDFQWFIELLGDTAEAISKGVFPRSKPDEWWCDSRFCDVWDKCRGRDYKKQPSGKITIDIPVTQAVAAEPDHLDSLVQQAKEESFEL